MGACVWTWSSANTSLHIAYGAFEYVLYIDIDFSRTIWKSSIWICISTVSGLSRLHACVQYLDSRRGNLEVVQSSQGALSICEVGSSQLMEQLQGHHWAVAVALRLLIQLLLVQENGQRLLSCGWKSWSCWTIWLSCYWSIESFLWCAYKVEIFEW